MIEAKDAVVWVRRDTKEVMVRPHSWGVSEDRERRHWVDPIGAGYSEWAKATNAQRMRLMLETVIDLGMDGFALKDVLTAFAEVREFHALGGESYPMCRALTAALLGHSYEFNTMSFEELLVHYAPGG
jgi:hypothetical protein